MSEDRAVVEGGVSRDGDLPTGEIREHMVGDKLWIHIDADDPDHPLEKKALLRGIPVPVKR